MKAIIEWIETSERLPENDDIMLVTCEKKTGERSLNRAYYMKSNKSWHGSGSMSNVIAWADVKPYYGDKNICDMYPTKSMIRKAGEANDN